MELIIRAKNKTTGEVVDFTAKQWYDAFQTGNYEKLNVFHKTNTFTAPEYKAPKPYRGCPCKNK